MPDGVVVASPNEISPVACANASAPASEESTQQVANQNDVLEGRVVTVDQPHESGPANLLAELAARRRERSPVVPLWLRSRTDALQVLTWQAEHTGYVLAYHVLRIPKYVVKLPARPA
jgi:S-DNA-T family DNA segregation ATPase FtsK/SpoIIIE